MASWRHFVCVFFFLTLHILVPFDYTANIFKELNKLFAVFFLLSRHVQKGHPSLVTQVDLILQDWGEFKVFETLWTGYPVAQTFYGKLHSLQFLISSWRFLRISGNGRRRNFDNFPFFTYVKSYSEPPAKCKIYRKNLKKNLWKTVKNVNFYNVKNIFFVTLRIYHVQK